MRKLRSFHESLYSLHKLPVGPYVSMMRGLDLVGSDSARCLVHNKGNWFTEKFINISKDYYACYNCNVLTETMPRGNISIFPEVLRSKERLLFHHRETNKTCPKCNKKLYDLKVPAESDIFLIVLDQGATFLVDESTRSTAMTSERKCLTYRIDTAVFFLKRYHYMVHQFYADGSGGRIIDTLPKTNRIIEHDRGYVLKNSRDRELLDQRYRDPSSYNMLILSLCSTNSDSVQVPLLHDPADKLFRKDIIHLNRAEILSINVPFGTLRLIVKIRLISGRKPFVSRFWMDQRSPNRIHL